MHTYHFYAVTVAGDASVDGVLELDSPLRDMEDYRDAKVAIQAKFSIGPVILKSLTLLNPAQPLGN